MKEYFRTVTVSGEPASYKQTQLKLLFSKVELEIICTEASLQMYPVSPL